jgi:uncharacterized membrane protein YkgB
VKIFQSKINGELFLAYDVFTKTDRIEIQPSLTEASYLSFMYEDEHSLGVLIETSKGYAGIFKSMDKIYKSAVYIGEI